MLKIRDDVDLKELEKYGFKQSKIKRWLKKAINGIHYWIDKEKRYIEIGVYDDLGEVESDDTLYDLIKADIVVKE